MPTNKEYAVIGWEIYEAIQDKMSRTERAWKPTRDPIVEYLCDLLTDVEKGKETPEANIMRASIKDILGNAEPHRVRSICDDTRALRVIGPIPQQGEIHERYSNIALICERFYNRMKDQP